MEFSLTPHPDTPCPAVHAISVTASRPAPGELTLAYRVTGRMAALKFPAAAAPARADDLWRHTCFEAFLRGPEPDPYYEINLSPSTCWAAYRFAGYRNGMTDAELNPAPAIACYGNEGGFELAVTLNPASFAALAGDAPWQLGLSAVVEPTAGGLSYWALAHAPGKPDFHHEDCFAAELFPA